MFLKMVFNSTKENMLRKKINGLLSKGMSNIYLRILTEKKHRQIKLQRLEKVGIWASGLLVHQINSHKRFLN